MAKVTDFKNPVNGQKENLFSLETWKNGILGVMFGLAVLILGQTAFSKVAGKTGIQSNMAPIVREPQRQKETNSVTILK